MCPPDVPDPPKPIGPPPAPEESAELALKDSTEDRIKRGNRSGARALTIPMNIPPLSAGGLGGVA